MRAHAGAWVEPLRATVRGTEILEMPPPTQGMTALEALRITDGLIDGADGPDRQHLLIEAVKLALADRHEYLGDPDAMTTWAEENGMAGSSYADIVGSDKVREMIDGYVAELNSKLNRWETIKKWEILDHDLSIETGELTPSMKVKRNVVEVNNKDRIAAFYS